MYPKFGPGHLWETVASIIEDKGGRIIKNSEVVGITIEQNKVIAVQYRDTATNKNISICGDYLLSTMPVKELILAIGDTVPREVAEVSN